MDFWFILHNGLIWPHSAFEPLFIGWNLFPNSPPLSPFYPWQVKQEWTRVVDLGRDLVENVSVQS
jgi:hypothetical protein